MPAYEISPITMCADCKVRRDIPEADTMERLQAQRGVEQVLQVADEMFNQFVHGGWQGLDELRNLTKLSERYAESVLECAKQHKAGECTIKFSEVMVDIDS